jgi:hypothetical protein
VRSIDLAAKRARLPFDMEAGSALRSRLYRSTRRLRARATFLATHPLCRPCEQEGRVTPASIVDHVDGHRSAEWLTRFWDPARWQPCCGQGHAAESARELAEWQEGAGSLSTTLGATDRLGSFARNTPMTLRTSTLAERNKAPRKAVRLPPPDGLLRGAAAVWKAVVNHLNEDGSLLAVDTGTIETYALAVVRQRVFSKKLHEGGDFRALQGKLDPAGIGCAHAQEICGADRLAKTLDAGLRKFRGEQCRTDEPVRAGDRSHARNLRAVPERS